TWRRHYERLHLHTVKQYSALPRMRWPDHVPLYPSRADVVDYLEAYARRFGIEPAFGQRVENARFDASISKWIVRTQDSEFKGRALVIATGYNRVPNIPAWPGSEKYKGEILHSSAYKNGRAWRGKRALVIGIGNTGGEIALDLWESGAETTVSVRS